MRKAVSGKRGTPTATLVQVARLYYLEHLGQREIAERLGVSRSLIAQHLKKARDRGLVRIEIADPDDRRAGLAARIRRNAGIAHVEVVSEAGTAALTSGAVCTCAAEHLDRRLKPRDVLGLAWGRSVMEVVGALAPRAPRPVEVVPLLGERSNLGRYTQLNQLVMQAGERVGGTPYFLLAPMLVGTARLRRELLKEEEVRRVVALWDRLDAACFGVGVVPPTPGMIPYLGEEFIPALRDAGAVGDICGRYFDRNGKVLPSGLEDRILGVTVKQLRKARLAVAVAHGAGKGRAVAAALRTGLVSALFVDRACAEVILEEQA
jgi:DNA-binding transcriptional regulator LsrR (DeoR family)